MQIHCLLVLHFFFSKLHPKKSLPEKPSSSLMTSSVQFVVLLVAVLLETAHLVKFEISVRMNDERRISVGLPNPET